METMRMRNILAGSAAVLILAAGCSGGDDPPPAAGGGTTRPTAGSASAGQGTSPMSASSPATSPAGPTTTVPGAPLTEPVRFSTLTGESTRLTVNAAFLDALRSVGGDLQPVGGAQAETAGGRTTLVFPVTGGRATVDPTGTERLSGTVQHRGGLRLSALGRSATIEDFVLDADSGQLTAMIGGRRVPLLPVNASDARITRQGDTVVVTDEAVALNSDAAGQLARQLGLPALPSVDLGQLQTTLTGSS